ncbi:MAG TPA: argininosuccinate lyase [Actinobacteria bacterium]|nr:argininosuccinate lyase [Actinomycetota bacterium]
MTLWGGRFAEPPDDTLWRFTVDPIDRRLLTEDVAGSRAHVAMLGEVGLLTAEETVTLTEGLDRILAEANEGRFEFLPEDEDVHSAVERRLYELVGPVAGKLHTGRSRNDQVCLDLRLYLRRACDRRIDQLYDLVAVLVAKAEEVGETIVAAYTHLQQAQAIPLAHHLLAHAWRLVRDAERFRDARDRIDVSPLGAGAAAGSSLPLDPELVAEYLKFPRVFDNSLDAVAARDFAAEFVFACAAAMVTLSRMSEELVLWASEEFGWVRLADRYTTGSSALPHKKNPDIAELARGKAASVIGDLTGILALEKGLPLSYDRDLQEDKRAVFHADDVLTEALAALAGMVATAEFDPPPPSPWVTALDLAEALVARGVPFREAHAAVGRLVARLVAEGRTLVTVAFEDLEGAHPGFVPEDLDRIDPRGSVEARRTPGGGSFSSVADQLRHLREILDAR